MNLIWLFGLSGSGKTTLGSALAVDMGYLYIDADAVRVASERQHPLDYTIHGRLAFQNHLRNEVGHLLSQGYNVVVGSITPYRVMRTLNRTIFCGDHYIEVLLDCDIFTLMRRDPKGLYAKAVRGEIKNFTGISDTFEADNPEPHLIIDTGKSTKEIAYMELRTGVRACLSNYRM